MLSILLVALGHHVRATADKPPPDPSVEPPKPLPWHVKFTLWGWGLYIVASVIAQIWTGETCSPHPCSP